MTPKKIQEFKDKNPEKAFLLDDEQIIKLIEKEKGGNIEIIEEPVKTYTAEQISKMSKEELESLISFNLIKLNLNKLKSIAEDIIITRKQIKGTFNVGDLVQFTPQAKKWMRKYDPLDDINKVSIDTVYEIIIMPSAPVSFTLVPSTEIAYRYNTTDRLPIDNVRRTINKDYWADGKLTSTLVPYDENKKPPRRRSILRNNLEDIFDFGNEEMENSPYSKNNTYPGVDLFEELIRGANKLRKEDSFNEIIRRQSEEDIKLLEEEVEKSFQKEAQEKFRNTLVNNIGKNKNKTRKG